MDILNENLAQLKLMNSRPLSPKSPATTSLSSGSATTNNRSNDCINNGNGNNETIINNIYQQQQQHKNTGPAVPPKPLKKNSAQIPYSSNIRQTCEPLYSKNLNQQKNISPTTMPSQQQQSILVPNSGDNEMNGVKIALNPTSSLSAKSIILAGHHQQQQQQQTQQQQQQQQQQQHHSPLMHSPIVNNKQQLHYHPQSHYSNMEMTLDNPAILNQQLEALEYHKKQLEMKGMLPSSPNASATITTSNNNHYNHKLMNNTKLLVDKFQNEALLKQQIHPHQQLQQIPHNHVYSNSMALKSIAGSKIPSASSLSPSPTPSSLSSSGVPSSAINNSVGINFKKNSDIVYSNILHQHQQQQQQKQNSFSLRNSPSPVVISSSGSPYPNSINSNQVYTNINYNSGLAEIPPPSPIELQSGGAHNHDYSQHQSQQQQLVQQQIINEDDLPPPPSPVSSSYSELRRATDNFPQMPVYPLPSVYDNSGGGCLSISSAIDPLSGATDQQTYVNTSFQNDYSTYGPISQDSSTYESIYEPINPRPPSQLSSRSNYSLYTSYVNGVQSASPATPIGGGVATAMQQGMVASGGINVRGVGGRLSSKNKEVEVETLTDLLVHSMDAGCDVDSFGVCVKCGERVVGENSGCTAMEQIYHISCFTCAVCQINLQGKPFYALDGKPHCEEDYLNTLEKCSVCMKPILERILRATGKPYHPGCFTCIVCGNSLDGIPFTVDASNQNYCIEDFHKKFAPRCCVCKQPIMPEPGQEETVRVVALDRSFHFECYKCEDCGLLLSSEAEGRGCYPLDDHVLCKSCNAKRVQALTNCMTTEL